jgi:hypothetical protein
MRAIAIGLLTVITWTSHCLAYGSIARGYAGRSIRFIYITDLPTGTDEQSSVISACTLQGLTSCEIVINFRDRCVSVATNPTGAYSTALGDTVERARTNATTASTATYRSFCADAVSVCDQTPAIEPPEPTYDFSFLGDPGFWRVGQIISVVTYGGTAIVVTLLLSLFLAILSTVSPDVLQRRAALFTWIALPSLPIAAGWAFIPFHPIPGGYAGFILLCWTVVFAALGVGTKLRWLVIHRKNAPDVLSLPLAVFLFSVVTFRSVR